MAQRKRSNVPSIKISVSVPTSLWTAACERMPNAKASHIVRDALAYALACSCCGLIECAPDCDEIAFV